MNARLPIAAALLLALLLLLPAAAQETPALPVAVLNLDVLFKEDRGVTNALARLRAEAQELDKTVALRQAELEAVQADLRKAQPGSADFRKLQQEVIKLTGELQQFIQRERANVQLKEAKIYLAAYRDIEEVVKEYCKQRGIKLVIRQQTTSLAEDQPAQEIVKALNRIVIFEEGLDITEEIHKRVKAKGEKAQ
jgi:Skp family chaperone for outer membrane proteins